MYSVGDQTRPSAGMPPIQRRWIGSLRLGVSHVRQCWLSWTVFLGIAGSLGVYGLGWLVDEFQFALWGDAAGQPWLGPQVGGLYWLMTLLLPGYVLFRYPAKLLIVASLALSLLGALGWDQACDAKATRMHRVLALFLEKIIEGKIGTTNPQFFDNVRSVNL